MVQQRKIAKYVLLQIVTLGIYGLFFWSDWTEDVNKMCEDDNKESANYILVFVLDIFTFGIFSLIWNYSMSERMYRIAPKYGIELKYGGSRVLLLRTILFFLPVFGSVAKLKMFNTLAVAYNATLDEEEIVLSTMKEKKPKKETKAEKKASKKAAKKGAVAEVVAPVAEAVAPVAEAVAPVAEAVAPVAEVVAPVAEVIAPVAEAEPVTETVQLDEITIETVDVSETNEVEFSEPVYEIADIDIPDIKFAETPVEIETVDEIEFTEPAAYEISTDIPEVAFIDDEPLAPASKEDVLKQATKTVGNKRTVKEKVAKEPAAKKSTKAAEEKAVKATKTAEEKATKSTKAKKETATKSTAKKETAKKETAKKETKPKTTKAAKEKAKKEVEKIVDEVKIDDLTFGEITFEEVNLEADILNEIAEISKSKK